MACLRSPLAGPLEDDDLLAEILLRLPPLPSSLPRASAVSRRWCSLVSDPHFSRRFRAHHRRNSPILGCFVKKFSDIFFEPALEAPNRVPQGSFSFLTDAGDLFVPLGCRHGLVLMVHISPYQLLIWDPITGDQHFLDIPPPGFENNISGGAVLRAAGDVCHFQVVVVGTNDMQAVASVYSSDTGIWGNLITMTLSPTLSPDDPAGFYPGMLPVMVEDSIYWLFSGNSGIIEFDLARQTLALIATPVDVTGGNVNRDIWVVPAEGGVLGFLSLTGFCAQLWKREKDCDGDASWVLGRSIQLDKLLSLNPETEQEGPLIVGFAEDNNVVLEWTSISIFTVQLESLQFKKLFKSDKQYFFIYPYEVVYIAEKGIDGGHNGAELLQST